jgi:hypothetical protein
MIVSKDLGFFTIKKANSKREKAIAPQRQVGQIGNDFGSSSDDEPYSTRPQKAGLPYCPAPRSFMRRPQNKAVNASRPEGLHNNVPLKSLQEFSHAEGASLFNAPSVPYMRRLPIREDKPREIFLSHYAHDYDVPFEHPLDYEGGMRPGMRRMPVQKDTPEPVGAVFRPNTRPAAERIVATDYDVGDAELAQMMKTML